MKPNKILFTLGLLFLIYLNSFSQTAGRKEWIEKDVSIFKHYFEIFPLNNTKSVDDLKSKLKLFKYSKIDSMGFGGVLRWWTCPGGYITIGATILSYKNQIVMVVTTIDNYYISSLNRVFKQDSTLKIKFNKVFTVKKNTHDFQDSTYEYTYINQPLLEGYKNHISEFFGKQTIVNIENCQFEYNLLNSPVSRYQLVNPAHKNYPPNYAVTKLKKENRVDCLLNIIRGYSLTGRIYGIRGLLELVKEGKYILTKDDKELIKKVLSLNLTVEEGSIDLIAELKYNECIQPILLEVLKDDYKYQKDSIYDKMKRYQNEAVIIEQNPEYKGGYEAMQQFLKKNLIYPDSALKKKIQGSVFVQFVVNKTGKLSNVKILRGIGGGCDEEAVRVVNLMPDWIPARGDGETAPAFFQIPVKFSLNTQQ